MTKPCQDAEYILIRSLFARNETHFISTAVLHHDCARQVAVFLQDPSICLGDQLDDVRTTRTTIMTTRQPERLGHVARQSRSKLEKWSPQTHGKQLVDPSRIKTATSWGRSSDQENDTNGSIKLSEMRSSLSFDNETPGHSPGLLLKCVHHNLRFPLQRYHSPWSTRHPCAGRCGCSEPAAWILHRLQWFPEPQNEKRKQLAIYETLGCSKSVAELPGRPAALLFLEVLLWAIPSLTPHIARRWVLEALSILTIQRRDLLEEFENNVKHLWLGFCYHTCIHSAARNWQKWFNFKTLNKDTILIRKLSTINPQASHKFLKIYMHAQRPRLHTKRQIEISRIL